MVSQLGTGAESAEGKSLETLALSDKQAARYINMSSSWLRQSRMAGRTDGPVFLRIGSRTIRYLRADLDRWLDRRRCPNSQTQAELATRPEPLAPHLEQAMKPATDALGAAAVRPADAPIDTRRYKVTPRQPPPGRTRRRRKPYKSSP